MSGDIEARRLVIRVDSEGNAGTSLQKIDKDSKQLQKTSQSTSKNIQKNVKENTHLLSTTREVFSELTGSLPLLNKTLNTVFRGVERVSRGFKIFNRETRVTQQTFGPRSTLVGPTRYPSVFNMPSQNLASEGEANASGGGMGLAGGLLAGGAIGAAILGAAKLTSAAIDHIANAASLRSEERQTGAQLQFQLKNLGNLPIESQKVYDKMEVNFADIARTLTAGAKELLDPNKMGKILGNVVANARALGTDSSAVMAAYGRSSSTGSADFLELNRSALVNAGYGKKVMQDQLKLQAYQQTIAASGNNPLIQQRLQPQIQRILDSEMAIVSKKANSSTMALDKYQSQQFQKTEKLTKFGAGAYWAPFSKDGALDIGSNPLRNTSSSGNTYNTVIHNDGTKVRRSGNQSSDIMTPDMYK